MSSQPDGQKSRSIATQKALMLAAEKLIAKNGIHNVSIREIVKEAKQKNESVLQYHFTNLQGLVDAIRQSRNEETHQKRAELLDELLAENNEPSVRDLCRIMVMPTYLLAKANPAFRRFIIAFSSEIALAPDSALSTVNKGGGGGQSGRRTGELLRAVLPHLDEDAYRQRMESLVRLASISMGYHARQTNAFRGASSDYFLNSLLDAMVGLLREPVSAETMATTKPK
jgi:AcrR family transcriptional regulator